MNRNFNFNHIFEKEIKFVPKFKYLRSWLLIVNYLGLLMLEAGLVNKCCLLLLNFITLQDLLEVLFLCFDCFFRHDVMLLLKNFSDTTPLVLIQILWDCSVGMCRAYLVQYYYEILIKLKKITSVFQYEPYAITMTMNVCFVSGDALKH